ncbi:PaaI family thioesterase [Solirhodobacter olei]|uniref:PaaI family thioesterase n=1 Tax=Solirhodobacter olei TaxID=2493082 RepID=UPI000FDB52EC|nr:PaaI family thioesterase [Solirhodobacter olei]
MSRPPPEPVQVVKQRRDAALSTLVAAVPYIGFLGVGFDRRGDELTAILPFSDRLIGNPALPALHGGATAAFLEITAIVELAWAQLWEEMEAGRLDPGTLSGRIPLLPKTIDLTVDYLRAGLPRDAYARAHITRSGRRYASVRVEAWQDNRARPFAQASGHFLMPGEEG